MAFDLGPETQSLELRYPKHPLREPEDGGYCKIFNMPGRRTVLIKPLNDKEMSVLAIVARHHDTLHEAQVSKDFQRQKGRYGEALPR